MHRWLSAETAAGFTGNNHGCRSIVWRCIGRLDPTSAEMDCTNRTVNERLLQEITIKAFHQMLTERNFFLQTLQQNIARAAANADTLSPDGIQARLEKLQKAHQEGRQ